MLKTDSGLNTHSFRVVDQTLQVFKWEFVSTVPLNSVSNFPLNTRVKSQRRRSKKFLYRYHYIPVLQTIVSPFTLRFALWWRLSSLLRWNRSCFAVRPAPQSRTHWPRSEGELDPLAVHSVSSLAVETIRESVRLNGFCGVWKAKLGDGNGVSTANFHDTVVFFLNFLLKQNIFDSLLRGCGDWGWCLYALLKKRHIRRHVILPLQPNHGECWHRPQRRKKKKFFSPVLLLKGGDWWHTYLVTASITLVIFPLLH